MLILFCFSAHFLIGKGFYNSHVLQSKNRTRIFLEFQGQRSFQNGTRYFGLNFGLKAKCKYKLGVSYSQLIGNYKTDDFPVNPILYTSADVGTRVDAQFIGLYFSPIFKKGKRVNLLFPLHLGFANLSADYQTVSNGYNNYLQETAGFGSAGVHADFRLLAILKLGLDFSYRYVLTESKIAQEAFNTPLLGVSLRIGRTCKR